MVLIEDDADLDPKRLVDTCLYQLLDRLKKGSYRESELSQLTEAWSNPILFNQVDINVVSALVEIVNLCHRPAAIVHRALQLLQAHLSEHIQHLPKFLIILPEDLKLSLLSTLCVASEPRYTSRALIWSNVHQHLDLVARSMSSQESMEIVRFYAAAADDKAVESVMAATLIQNGIWRLLCSNSMESQLHIDSVLVGLQSIRLADYFSRANIRFIDNFKGCPGGMAIAVALSLRTTHEPDAWHAMATRFFNELISSAFTDPNRLIQLLDMVPNSELFRVSCYGTKLKELRSSIVANEGGPDSKTAKRLNRMIDAKLKTSIKAD